MRLFIAIELSEDMKAALERIQASLRRRGLRGSYTPAENLHLTLAFIGEYPDPDAVLRAMETAEFDPFPLRLEGFGSFRDLWWAGLSESAELTACAKRLRRVLAKNSSHTSHCCAGRSGTGGNPCRPPMCRTPGWRSAASASCARTEAKTE